MPLRLLQQLRAHADLRPDDPALRAAGSDRSTTWRELAERVDVVALELGRHVPPGRLIILQYPNSPDYICAFLAVLAAGCAVFPVACDVAETELLAHTAGATAALSALSDRDGFRESCILADVAQTTLMTEPTWSPREVAGPGLVLHSSGTTGKPKLVFRDAASLDAVSLNMVRACGFTADDRVLAVVPLCHSYGVEHGLLAPIWAGSCVHVCDGFDVSLVVRELREQAISMLPGVPFMFEALCQAWDKRISNLKRAYSAGGPLPRTVFDQFLAISGVRVTQLYGATEVGSVTFNSPEADGFDPESVGTPMEGVSVRILCETNRTLPPGEEGQVAIRAPSMFSGYLNEGPPPLADGHFLTGDLGRLDERGALTITGRLKLLVDVGGRKVNPAEVESVLRLHPRVGQCVVVMLKVSQTVNRLKAVVTPARADRPPTAGELRAFARERLTPYKVPRVFEIRSSLPLSASGKVLRHLVEAP